MSVMKDYALPGSNHSCLYDPLSDTVIFQQHYTYNKVVAFLIFPSIILTCGFLMAMYCFTENYKQRHKVKKTIKPKIPPSDFEKHHIGAVYLGTIPRPNAIGAVQFMQLDPGQLDQSQTDHEQFGHSSS